MTAAALAGRHAVVTGASRGIGAVVAEALAADGALVSLLARDAAQLERVA
ncbi:MAG: SDR family NAD(P)-dependent oxidoreductase, partial [Steroidobacteraceae bacterium]